MALDESITDGSIHGRIGKSAYFALQFRQGTKSLSFFLLHKSAIPLAYKVGSGKYPALRCFKGLLISVSSLDSSLIYTLGEGSDSLCVQPGT